MEKYRGMFKHESETEVFVCNEHNIFTGCIWIESLLALPNESHFVMKK